MHQALTGFLDTLRARGVAVSPAEALDALRAVAELGVESRPQMRSALALTCAKNRHDRRLLEETFDLYFAAPARRGGGERGGSAAAGAEVGTGHGESGGGGRAPALPSRPPPAPGPRSEPRHTRRTLPGAPPGSTSPPLAEELRRLQSGRSARLRHLHLARGAAPLPSPRAAAAAAITPDPRRQELRSPMSGADERRLAEEAATLVAELRLREGRRYAPGRRGRLALKRTLRRSLASGGVPFVLHHERRRPRRPRVVLLLDVSRSVTRAAGLFLLLAARLLERVARTRVYAFVDRPVECTAPLLAWARGGRPPRSGAPTAAPASFAQALTGVAGLNLDAPSDYGRVFYALGEERGLRAGRDLVLLVLGDGRSNHLDPQDWAFADLGRRARLVVWLVPEPAASWGSGDSALAAYLPQADLVAETADLAGLARGLTLVLRQVRA